MTLFGSKRQLFDCEIEPDGEGEAGGDALPAVGEPAGPTRRGLNGEGRLPGEMGEGADPEDDENEKGEGGDGDGDAEGEFDAGDVHADEEGVEGGPEERCRDRQAEGALEDRADVAADADDDHGGGEDVLDALGEPRQEAAPGTERGSTEGVRPARMRQRRRELGDRETQTDVHDGDDGRREQ